jgi:hypothetical protein
MRAAVVIVFGCACGARTPLDGAPPDAGDAGIDVGVDSPSPPPPPPPPPGSACTATQPTLLATTQGGTIDQIAVDAGYVYFHHAGDMAAWGVTAVPKGGGASFLVAQNIYEMESSVAVFAIDAAHITWLDGGLVKQASIGGGASVTFVDPGVPTHYYESLDATPTGFLASRDDTFLDAIDAQGGAMTVSADILLATYKTLEDGSTIFGASWQGGMWRLDGGVVMALGTVTAYDFVLDDTDIFFTEQFSASNASVWRVPKTGGPATAIAVLGNAFGGGIALGGTMLYYADKGDVVRIAKDGTAPVTIGTPGDDSTAGVAVDDQCVYWGTIAGQVWAAPL